MNDLSNYEKNAGNRTEEEIVLSFCDLLRKELLFRKGKGLDCNALKIYYRNLFTNDDQVMPLGALGYAQRLSPILSMIRKEKPALRILDAGSGYGTESFLFSSFGHTVVGLELVSDRVALARSRLGFFYKIGNLPLDLHFIHANIFGFLEKSDPFDIIWAMEAISHIFPPEHFLNLAFQKLPPGGRLILSDPNSLNPLAWGRSVRIRGSFKHSPHTRFNDPETHCPVAYGQEKIYPFFTLRRMLRRAGFQVKETQVSGFLCSSFFPKKLQCNKSLYGPMKKFQRILMRTPVLQSLGSIYTIVATKSP